MQSAESSQRAPSETILIVYHGWTVTKAPDVITNLGVVRGTWRLWLGIAGVVFMGIPVMQVFSWIVGGFWGILGLVALGAGAALILWSSKDSPNRP